MDFQFLGGASEVGRLGMILKKGPISLLFDYGLLPRDPPQYPMPAPPVDGMFISHAHLDHTGMIPWVTRRQDLDVVLTPPTADVADLLLQDSLKIADAEGFDAPFDDRDLRTARRRFRTIDFGDNVDIGDLEVTAHPAGHIPGATMYEVNGTETTLFTGDLHTLTTDLVWGARPVKCDTLFIESTYAGRQHPERLKSEHAFLRKIEQVVNRGGLALVPSFAVGRTQDVILTLATARASGRSSTSARTRATTISCGSSKAVTRNGSCSCTGKIARFLPTRSRGAKSSCRKRASGTRSRRRRSSRSSPAGLSRHTSGAWGLP